MDSTAHAPELPSIPAAPFLFVSYASADRERVLGLVEGVEGLGLPVWIDQAGIAGGAAYGTEIANALRASAAVLLMCSAASLASRNVRQEIMLAWRYERPIIPLLLEATTFPDDVAYWLEGAQWIETFGRATSDWRGALIRALSRHGFEVVQTKSDRPDAGGEAPLPPGNLPLPAGALIGRDRELAELTTLIRNSRWVTLTGPGGTGKSRLAIEAARRARAEYSDGVWFVDLASAARPEQVLPAIAATLDVGETEAGLVESLAAALQGRILLVLDNLEHLAAAGPILADLVARSEQLHVVATSRIPLRVAGEWVYAVGQLPLPNLDALPPPATLMRSPSVQLFVERARAARSDFVLTDGNARPVAEICIRLDGLPLAIELAAARVRMLPPATILTRLGSRLQLLTGGDALNARQQTLRRAISWSVDMLEPSEQLAFRGLAVFAGGAPVDVAETVLAEVQPGVGLDELTALVDHSLLQIEHGQLDDTPRVRMLETIREYALELLAEHGERERMFSAHAAAYRALSASLERDWSTPGAAPALVRLRPEDSNLAVAIDWLAEQGEPSDLLDLVTSLIEYWRLTGRFTIAASSLDRALARSSDVADRLRACLALEGRAFFSLGMSDIPGAIELLTRAELIRTGIGDPAELERVRLQLAEAHATAGDLSDAAQLQRKVLESRLERGDGMAAATARVELAFTSLRMGEYAHARDEALASLPVLRKAANAQNIADVLNVITVAEMLLGELDDAAAHAMESATISRSLGDAYALSAALVNEARVHQLAGRHTAGEAALAEALAIFEEADDDEGRSLCFFTRGLIALAQGRLADATSQLSRSLALAAAHGDPWHIAERLEALAAVAIADGRAHIAARFFGKSLAMREEHRYRVPPVEQFRHAQTGNAIRSALGANAEELIAADGASPVDEIVNLALLEMAG